MKKKREGKKKLTEEEPIGDVREKRTCFTILPSVVVTFHSSGIHHLLDVLMISVCR